MARFLGIDTSNYTTSCALIDTESGQLISKKKLLPVKQGDRGIRQSDAVFHHTRQLCALMEELFVGGKEIAAAAYSCKPREAEGSYMPCFLVGENVCRSLGAAGGFEVYSTSHQMGHILAALYSCKRLGLLSGDKPFLAFHVSGGTTDLLYCVPDRERVLRIEEAGHSLDLKAGQCIDRAGVMLGLSFPCGRALEELALKSQASFKIRPVMKGLDCSLSGIENKFMKMHEQGRSREDIALFTLESVYQAVRGMTLAAMEKFGELPVICAGGVMADKIIRDKLEREFDCSFAEPELSCDNAVGIAVYAWLKGMV